MIICADPGGAELRRCADEKNDRLKGLIKSKVNEYLERAEKLKAHIAAQDKKSKSAVGADGKPSTGKK
jgi:vacuolar protein-sorting-associated protein 4